MLYFESDYTEGAHEKILARLMETNRESLSGYGRDCYCDAAKEKIRQACQCPQAEVFFLVGGTQTNATIIDALLSRYQGVLAAASGHINTHEAGAIEAGGHKVLELPQHAGKIAAAELESYLQRFWQDANHEHMVFPGMLYLSHPTEYGALYSKAELLEISAICKAYSLPLYVDGARLGYGLMARDTDVSLPVLAQCCDVFYIGGTKVGALCGEAVVFSGQNVPPHFMTIVKQHGALLAKGRLLGVQFDTLFTNGLYFEISRHAIDMAELLKAGLAERGCHFYLASPTNQQFIIMEDKALQELAKQVKFSFWEKLDDRHTVIRLVTSWATREEDVRQLLALLDSFPLASL